MKRKWLVILFPIAYLLLIITRAYPWIAEFVFARGIYKYYALGWSSITQWIPFSIMELGIILLPILVIGWGIWFLIQLIRKKGERICFVKKTFLSILCMASIVFFWLTITCSINYNRYTFAEISGLEIKDSTQEELYQLCLKLTEDANTLREMLNKVNENKAMLLENNSVRELSKTAKAAYQDLGETYSVFRYRVPYSKPVYFSRAMSYTNLVGIYCPFTMETNINIDVSEYSIPSSICHELAHYYGFMREDEANFISYLACMNSDSIEFQYSGTMLALIYAGNQLYAIDAEKYQEIWNHYSEKIKIDLIENNLYWESLKQNKIREVSEAVNDAYLKANHQTDGVRSYGRMVDLLLALYREK